MTPFGEAPSPIVSDMQIRIKAFNTHRWVIT